MNVTLYDIAQRFIGQKEVPGKASNPLILAMLTLFAKWPTSDAVPWCSAFLTFCAWLLDLPHSTSLRARSWLLIGKSIELEDAAPGFDVVILQRGSGSQPGPEVIKAPGHVGLFAGLEAKHVLLLGGNQSDTVSIARYPRSRVLGVRRLAA